MTKREKELERALAGFERTGDEELDALVDTADDLTARLAAPTPIRPEGRAMFIEGVGARKRSIVSSLMVPGLAVIILLLSIAVLGRSALPGESLYPVRNVLRSAGLAEAPDEDIKREIGDAALLVGRARTALERDPSASRRLAVAALMSLGRATGYLNQVGPQDRVQFEDRIDALRRRAVALIRASHEDDSGSGSDDSGENDSSGSGSDASGSDDNSGSGSDDSGSDDNSGSGSDDSGSDDNSGSGSNDSGSDDNSGSGSDDSGGDDLESDD